MTAVLAVDLGKTGCRAAIWSDRTGEVHLVREVPGAPGLAAPGGVAAAEAAVIAACTLVLRESPTERLRAVCVGAAGAAAAPESARALADRLLTGLAADEVAVGSDAITAHAGALGARTGVVLAAGTGAVAVGVGDDGTLALVDGWGPWLGDEGSGAWIGLAGLRAALRAHDGRGPATPLEQTVVEQFGELRRLPAAVDLGDNPARVAAAFAPTVARAATAGDPVAAGIMRSAAEALGEAVVAAARRITGRANGPVPVAITGGLTHLGPPLLEPLTAMLAEAGPPLRLRLPLGGPLDGARRLACGHGSPHEPFLTRVRRERSAGAR